MERNNWYKLDNVGKLYSSLKGLKKPNVFRFSATLTEEVDELTLLEALKETLLVYPNFNVTLKQGLFWYYLEESDRKPVVKPEKLPITERIYTSSDDILYRVSYYKKRINLEVSHIIADGKGTTDFFTTLVNNYLAMKYNIKVKVDLPSSLEDKTEDSFDKYYKKTKIKASRDGKIYKYKNKQLKNRTRFMEMHMDVKDVLNLAHKYDATLTSLLLGVLVYSVKHEMKLKERNKVIKVEVPVDLRKYYKSNSTKNFFGMTSVSYKFGDKDPSIEEVIKDVDKQLKDSLTTEKLSERMNLMIALEKNVLMRSVPVILKDVVLMVINQFILGKPTTVLSNVGIMKFDPAVEDYIEDVNILNSTESFQFVVTSFKNKLSIGMSSVYKTNNIIKNFCRYFANEGIEVEINSNEV